MCETVCLDKLFDIRNNFAVYSVLWIQASIAGSHGKSCFYCVNDKWLKHKEIAYKKVTNCSKSIELKDLGRFLCKMKCRWENQVKKLHEI